MGFGSWMSTRLRRSTSTPAPGNQMSIGNPALVELFQIGVPNFSGVEVNESTAMSLSTVYRCVALIAGTIGTLPLRTMGLDPTTGRQRSWASFLDTPGGPYGPTQMSWSETVVAHLLLHGNAYLRHIYGGAGQLIALEPIHPLCVTIEWPMPGDDLWPLGGKWFRVTLIDGSYLRLDASQLTHIPGLSLDGVQGVSVISYARNSLGTALAGDRSAAKMFASGALMAGFASVEDGTEEDAKAVKADLARTASGWENAGSIPVINRKVTFTPWTMTAADAQFLESRQFEVEEIARWFGVTPVLLGRTGAVSNWGTGVAEQVDGLGRYVLNPWTCRIEQPLSRLLPNTRWAEYDYKGLERPTPEDEVNLVIAQFQAGLIDRDEARALLNIQTASGAASAPATEPDTSAVTE